MTYYRVRQIRHRVLATLVPKRTYTGEVQLLWVPQYRRGDNAEWNRFSDMPTKSYYGYQTPEEAEAHIERHNQNWQTLYEGRYPLKTREC